MSEWRKSFDMLKNHWQQYGPVSPPHVGRTVSPPHVGRTVSPPHVGRTVSPPHVGRTGQRVEKQSGQGTLSYDRPRAFRPVVASPYHTQPTPKIAMVFHPTPALPSSVFETGEWRRGEQPIQRCPKGAPPHGFSTAQERAGKRRQHLTVMTTVSTQLTVMTTVSTQLTVMTTVSTQLTVMTTVSTQLTVMTTVSTQLTVMTTVHTADRYDHCPHS
ncbi:hypothetical protein ACOMHN_067302 [Nucella lapillus]